MLQANLDLHWSYFEPLYTLLCVSESPPKLGVLGMVSKFGVCVESFMNTYLHMDMV